MARTLWIRDAYLAQILGGEKTVEVRVGYPNILRLKVGDVVRLNDRYPAKVHRMARYGSFDELLETEDPNQIAPRSSKEELLGALRAIYPPEKESLGAVAIELQVTEDED